MTPTQSEQLISSLTTNISILSKEVNRTYELYVSASDAYTAAIVWERELDRQRLYHMANGDYVNADIVSELLRAGVRAASVNTLISKDESLAAWNLAKDNLNTEKRKLSAAETAYLKASIDAAVATANAQAATSNAEAATTNANAAAIVQSTQAKGILSENEVKAAEIKRYVMIGFAVVAFIGVAFFVYKKFIKSK